MRAGCASSASPSCGSASSPGAGSRVGGRPTDRGKEVATVGVDDSTWVLNYVHTGDQVGWLMARGEPGAYGKQANYWWVTCSAPHRQAHLAAQPRRRRPTRFPRLPRLLPGRDRLRGGALWYPPLIYLLFRTFLMGFGYGERVEKTSNLPTWLLLSLAGLAAGLVLGLNTDSRVIDVGYAGVVGADRILEGSIPLRRLPRRRGHRRHLRPAELPALCSLRPDVRLLGKLGLRAGRPRPDRLRLRRRRDGALRNRLHTLRSQGRLCAGLRLGGLPVHALRDQQQHQRHNRRRHRGRWPGDGGLSRWRAGQPLPRASPSSRIPSSSRRCG